MSYELIDEKNFKEIVSSEVTYNIDELNKRKSQIQEEISMLQSRLSDIDEKISIYNNLQ